MPHNKWGQTVQLEPEVISMSFIPIASLLSGIDGSGFLGHAINLYLRCKQTNYFSLLVGNLFLFHMVSENLIRNIVANLKILTSSIILPDNHYSWKPCKQ